MRVTKWLLIIFITVPLLRYCWGGRYFKTDLHHPEIGKQVIFTEPVVQLININSYDDLLAKKYDSMIELKDVWENGALSESLPDVKSKPLSPNRYFVVESAFKIASYGLYSIGGGDLKFLVLRDDAGQVSAIEESDYEDIHQYTH